MQQANFMMKRDEEEEPHEKLPLLQAENQEGEYAPGMKNMLAIKDKSEESKSQQ